MSPVTSEVQGKANEVRRDAKQLASPPFAKVWIDLDNSPHVPFFAPIIEELQARGYPVLLTARDAFQVRELVELYHLNCKCLGRHYGKNKLLKLAGILVRALQLLPTIIKQRPALAVGHGARSQLALAWALRIPTVLINDYEHATDWAAFVRPTRVLVPEVIAERDIDISSDRIRKYHGIKEDVYVPSFTPDPRILAQLGLHADDIVVTMRPPHSEAHYHNPASDALFQAAMDFLGQHRVKIVLLPRNARQEALVRRSWPRLFAAGNVMVPPKVVDGLNLIWFSDLVISGGGTMNREAAALGVPVYSIFRGKIGAVDRYLSATNRLIMLESAEDVRTRIRLVHRDRPACPDRAPRPALQTIVSYILDLLERTAKCSCQLGRDGPGTEN